MTQLRLTFDPSLLTDDEIRNLNAIGSILDRIERIVPHVRAALPGCVEAVQLGMRLGASQGGGGVQTSDITDRTFATVAGRAKGHDLLRELAATPAEALGLLVALERLVTSQRREADVVTLAQVKDATRCSGMSLAGYSAWGRPDCQENALHGPLCGPCSDQARLWAASPHTYTPKASDGRTGARPNRAGLGERFGAINAATRFTRAMEAS